MLRMDNARHAVAQAQTADASPRTKKLSRRQRHWLRLNLRKLYRGLTGRVSHDYLLTEDAMGRAVLTMLRALRISDEIAERIAPWAELSEIDDAAAHYELTSDNAGEIIGRVIGLTYEQRETHKAWAFWPCDKTREE